MWLFKMFQSMDYKYILIGPPFHLLISQKELLKSQVSINLFNPSDWHFFPKLQMVVPELVLNLMFGLVNYKIYKSFKTQL